MLDQSSRAAAEWRPQADDRSTPVTIDESYRTGTPPSPPIGAPSEASTSWIPTSSSASAGGQLKTSDSGGQICTSFGVHISRQPIGVRDSEEVAIDEERQLPDADRG